VDLSVVIPFTDDEDEVGRLVRRVAAHLRARGARFEILAVDEGSGDNCVALLGLLRKTDVPELTLLAAPPGAGFATASERARGRVLWLFDVARAGAALAPFAWAYERCDAGVADVVVVQDRYALVRRSRAARAIAAVRGRAHVFERRLRRRSWFGGLHLDMVR
jgi:hypothetical protein